MESSSDSVIIPGWVWVITLMFIVGLVVSFSVTFKRRRSHRHRSSRHHSSGGSHRSRSSHSSSSRRHRGRSSDPFDKL